MTIQHSFFFFNDTQTTEIYTLSLHDALPISLPNLPRFQDAPQPPYLRDLVLDNPGVTYPILLGLDRKSTRLNSSHSSISYAVFCLKKKMFICTTVVVFYFHYSVTWCSSLISR